MILKVPFHFDETVLLTLFSLWLQLPSADGPQRRQRAGSLLPLRSDLRPPGMPVPVHRLRRPRQHPFLLHLSRGQQFT